MIVGLLLLGLLPVVGRFLPPTASWGFHHLAYFPVAAWMAAALLWLVLWTPFLRRGLDRLFFDGLGGWLFGGPWWPSLVTALLVNVLFHLLATPTHLLGDGVLIGELVGRGAQFRAADGMDYLLHRLILGWLGKVGDNDASFRLYAWGSWIAGFLAVMIALLLLRRSRLPRPTKLLAFLMWLACGTTLLYCGYAESYGYLSVTMLGFLWSGAMAERGEVSPWVPGIFFGLSCFFHSLGMIAAPALLWLILRPPRGREGGRRWVAPLLVPALVLPAIAIGAHLAAGFDAAWFRKEFIESKNRQQMLIPLTGRNGLFSITNTKDVLNWFLLVPPVASWLVIARGRTLWRRLREPEIAFLAIHAACFLIAFLLVDRKLGMARDWDIFTPQIGGLVWLAARLWEPETGAAPPGADRGWLPSPRFASVWVGLLLIWPWLAVNASRGASLQRFEEFRADFPTFSRAYATEELAKYYRDNGQYEKALKFYEECVQIYPRNARTRILLGTSYYAVNRFDDAIQQYEEALKCDPNAWMALDMESKLYTQQKDYPKAVEAFKRLVAVHDDDPDAWAGYGYAALQTQDYATSHDAFVKAAGMRIDPLLYYYCGITAGYLGTYDEAVEQLDRALRAGDRTDLTCLAMGYALEARAVTRAGEGHPVDMKQIQAARDIAARAKGASSPGGQIASYIQHLDRVLAGQEAPGNYMRP